MRFEHYIERLSKILSGVNRIIKSVTLLIDEFSTFSNVSKGILLVCTKKTNSCQPSSARLSSC